MSSYTINKNIITRVMYVHDLFTLNQFAALHSIPYSNENMCC